MGGNTITDKTKTAAAFRDFYIDLYSREATDEDIQNTYLQYCKKLSNEDRDESDTDITIDDLRKALYDMEEDKSPGPNGLTVKFYKTFFEDLAPLLA